MKGKLVLFLFALPFFGVGAWMTWSVGSSISDAWAMEEWVAVSGQLTDAGYETHSGDESNTYEAYASYTYVWMGQSYSGNRVSIGSGADNIGDYQQNLGDRLRHAMSGDGSITVYVNPDQPYESIIDREIRWSLIGFNMIFVLAFGGGGLGMLVFALLRKGKNKTGVVSTGNQPWLVNDDWQSATIKSNSKVAMYVAWGVALFWNLISAPLPFVIYDEVMSKGNVIALVGLLFPLVGLGLIKWAISKTMEWHRFGPAPITLDPFPGSIGGHVGGTIDLRLPYSAEHVFSATLNNLRSYVSGSGKNRSRSESAEWQETTVAHVGPGQDGSRLTFRFEVPDNLSPSDAEKDSDTYYLWRLSISADLSGADFSRDYEIPVYPTGVESQGLASHSIEKASQLQDGLDDKAVSNIATLSQGIDGKVLTFPMGRNWSAALVAVVTGGAFASVGLYLLGKESEFFMGGGFTIIGSIVAFTGAYLLTNSLEVSKVGMTLKSTRKILGMTVKSTKLQIANFVNFENRSRMQTSSSNGPVMHYTLYAVDRSGDSVVVAESLKGINQVDAARRLLGREFSLSAPEIRRSSSADEDLNYLAADS